ncbi:MAG: hypothetical protein OEL83_18275 [Desulforhopalus sp.]|nr:hypothetical protein [Desulforhopalus sp.]
MAKRLAARLSTLTLCLGILLWSGCSNYLKPEVGAVARKGARIALAGDVPAKSWETGDLIFKYSLAQKDQSYTLTGILTFTDSLTYTYPQVANFIFYLSFVDDGGKVVETFDLSPILNTFGTVPDRIPIRLSFVRPPGSSAIVFSYQGRFFDNQRESNGSWDIHYFPFN